MASPWAVIQVSLVVVALASSQTLASSGCDILLGGGDLQAAIVNTLAGNYVATNKLSIRQAKVTGYCGSVGVGNVTGQFSTYGMPSSIVLSTGSYATAISTANTVASSSTGSDYTGYFNQITAVTQYANNRVLQDALVLEVDLMLGTAATLNQEMTLDYVWATDEFSVAFEDLTVIVVQQCLDSNCTSLGSATLLSTLPSLEGAPIGLSSLRQKGGAVLVRNYKGFYPTPFDSFTAKISTVPYVLQPGYTYRVTAAVADAEDTNMDSMLLLGSMSLAEVGVDSPPLSATSPPPAGSGIAQPPPVTVESRSSSKSSKDVGKIVGPVVGVVGGLLLIALIATVIIFHRRKSGTLATAANTTPNPAYGGSATSGNGTVVSAVNGNGVTNGHAATNGNGSATKGLAGHV